MNSDWTLLLIEKKQKNDNREEIISKFWPGGNKERQFEFYCGTDKKKGERQRERIRERREIDR